MCRKKIKHILFNANHRIGIRCYVLYMMTAKYNHLGRITTSSSSTIMPQRKFRSVFFFLFFLFHFLFYFVLSCLCVYIVNSVDLRSYCVCFIFYLFIYSALHYTITEYYTLHPKYIKP